MNTPNTKTAPFFIYTALALSAAAALIYEVVASEVLLYFFVESTYSLATVLSVFLAGLAVGSLLYYRFQENIVNKIRFFGFLQLLIALYGYVVFAHIQDIIPALGTLSLFAVSVVLLLLPTVALGVIFPLTLSLIDDKRAAGFVYFVDLVGAVLGSLVAGFFLIPELGNTASVYVSVALSLVAAFLVLKIPGKVFAVILGIVFLIFVSTAEPIMVTMNGDVSFNKPSPFGEVAIEDNVLYIDGRDQCSWDYPDDTTERQVVDEVFKNITRPDAQVLNIGLGCGLTLERIIGNTNQTVDIVELNPVVVEANRLKTSLLDSDRINLIISEGVSYLRSSIKQYDSIIVDIENPAVVHASNLYTVESFNEMHDTLVDGGVFGLWVNRCQSGEYSDIIFNTLSRAFNHAYQINENIFLASDRELSYNAYVPFTDSRSVNTVDHKRLSKIYFTECRFGNEGMHYLQFDYEQ